MSRKVNGCGVGGGIKYFYTDYKTMPILIPNSLDGARDIFNPINSDYRIPI